MKTKVIFRKDRESKEIVAFFPEITGNFDPYTMMCYAHMGQHGIASKFYYWETLPAKEYQDLQSELESLGYDLEIRQKITPQMDQIRYDSLKSK